MEETLGVTGAGRIPSQQHGEPLRDTAARYAEERHWDVVPGVWLETTEGVERCSCGERACPAPGAHPADEDWAARATGSATVAREMWTQRPAAALLLPTGRTFDAIEVPETAGFLALARMERMGVTPGPVTRAPDRRMRFFVLPGGAAKAGDLVRRLGWSPEALGLRPLAEGSWLVAPPTRFGGQGAVQWARRPTPANRWLPDTQELISPLAYACGRETIPN
ncbi:bifunctional DNA primase/polymerase [Streptomyces sp. SPB074]|uniref:bifunctional DNA primase/polymerase n=1 Tax=Streptomyces sp. (strain SPB074) TaxID=465543 RepID=UPI00017FE980|nr:bifunctional DNA primase/polymerase [Streptomyces sp. SPB074]EDY43577.1 N- superfamily bifunctional DNA primase/polymerase [Streptomyces sp. SPB074]